MRKKMGAFTADKERVKVYMEYLHVEMNILGILAAFCAATMGLILSAVVTADKGFAETLWTHGRWYFIDGTILMALGALSFYRQRSGMAWTYGQLALSLLSHRVTKYTTEELLRWADSWDAWLHYHCGFMFTCSAFVVYLLAIVATITQPHIISVQAATFLTAVVLIVAIVTLFLWRRHIKNEDA